jgi:Protein of unknown function (DUF3616)
MKKLRFICENELKHWGACDASGAVALFDTNYVVIANDEDNILRVYDSQISGHPVASIDIVSYFKNNPKNREVDIEAATLLNGTIYWIGSHGRNKKAKERPERRNFFANKITINGQSFSAQQVGQSYSNLLEDMLADRKLEKYQLAKAEPLAPKQEGGLNIEGLCTTPEQQLLIGFRNPIREGKALLVPLKNPTDLIEKEDSSAIFGSPIDLDLGGLGIRSIEYWESQQLYLIAAGSYTSSDEFRFYQWSGNPDENPQVIEVINLPAGLNPEAIVTYPTKDDKIQIFSDDGTVNHDGETPCKDLPPDSDRKLFRSVWATVEVL